jgi:hypothetical protein
LKISIIINPYVTRTSENIKHNVNKCRQIISDKIKKDNEFLGKRIQYKQSYINSKKLEEEYLKNKCIRSKAKNFNLPSLKKLSHRILNTSHIHQKLLKTVSSTSSPMNNNRRLKTEEDSNCK